MIDATVRLDPIVTPVASLDPILMRIGAAARDGLVHRRRKALLIVGMDRRHNLRAAQVAQAERGIDAEAAREAFVDREAIRPQVP